MKKLYRHGTVHPSPSSSQFLSLSFLPTAILALVATLSADDKEVLAYLLSGSNNNPFDFNPSKSYKKHSHSLSNPSISNINTNTHVTCFSCYCFTCYTSYWARWDSSPNRQLIHEIIDALEGDLLAQKKKKQGVNRRDKKKNVNNKKLDYALINVMPNDIDDKCQASVRASLESGRVESGEDGIQLCDEIGEKQGIAKKMVSFIWRSLWG